MLIGTYRHSLDAKKRMRMPSKLKNEIGSNFIIAKGSCKNLLVFSKEEFQVIFDKLKALPVFDEEAQKPARKFLASAFEAEEDAQGRVLLSKELCNFAEITKEVVFVGLGNRVEIWSDKNWNDADSDENVSFSTLGGLGI